MRIFARPRLPDGDRVFISDEIFIADANQRPLLFRKRPVRYSEQLAFVGIEYATKTNRCAIAANDSDPQLVGAEGARRGRRQGQGAQACKVVGMQPFAIRVTQKQNPR